MKWIRKFYDFCLKEAEKPRAMWVMSVISAAESFFFPLPVDPLVMAMCTARPKHSIRIAMVCSFFSVIGAGIGYIVGMLFWSAFSGFFFEYIVDQNTFDMVMNEFRGNVFWGMFIAGFTPVPFKVFTVAGGVAQVALLPFFLGSAVSRTLRYGIIGTLFYFFGANIKDSIDKYFEKITLASGVLIIVVAAYIKFFH